MPRKMKAPSPPAPMSAAMATSPMFWTRTTRMPVTMTGSASGHSTERSRRRGTHPHAARRFDDGGIDRLEARQRVRNDGQERIEDERDQRGRRADAADAEFREGRKAAASAARGAIRIPNMAMLGIVCTTSRTGSAAARADGERWQDSRGERRSGSPARGCRRRGRGAAPPGSRTNQHSCGIRA